MASSELVNILTHTDVTRYLEFKQISGSYVYRDGKISKVLKLKDMRLIYLGRTDGCSLMVKVPATEMEALTSPLMGFFEKRRAKKFFEFIQTYNAAVPATTQGLDLSSVPMSEVYKKFGLEPGTQDFIGHSMALFLDDSYLQRPAIECHQRIVLYTKSLARYGKSPYVYPLYGLGELPQGFARLAAIYGGTYMLDKPCDELIYTDNRVSGVRSGSETVRCKAVICDPSYATTKSKRTGQVIRAICLLNHAIPNTGDVDSVQIILPQNQVGRKHDIYIACISYAHNICANGFWVAIVSTIVETSNPEAEIQPALNLLGVVKEKFVSVSEMFEPLEDGSKDGVFISRSYDATSHFDTVTDDVQSLYSRISGHPLSFDKRVRGPVDGQ